MRRGSISIYLSLTMLVMTALLAAVFYSVRAQAGRMQLANSVDQALFSTFAQYEYFSGIILFFSLKQFK
jgi:hypothetical protein